MTRRAVLLGGAAAVAALARVGGFGGMVGAAGAVTAGAPWIARHGIDAAAYQAAFDANLAAGYRLVHVAGYDTPAGARYAAIWEKAAGPAWAARHGLDSAGYQAAFTSFAQQGYRLRTVSGYAVGGVVRYAAVWEQAGGPAWTARHGLTAAQHQSEFDALLANGYRPVHVCGYATLQGPRFASIYEQTGGPAYEARHGLAGVTYQEAVDTWAVWGMRPVTVSGYFDGARDRYATIWQADGPAAASLLGLQGVIDRFVSTRAGAASQFAFAKAGRLVYARSFGVVDPAGSEPVSLRHRLRIASVSKPVTAAAVFSLVDAGRLTLDQRVFGSGEILGATYGTKPYNNHLRAITVRHLLEHSVGTWTNDANDPMFLANNLTQAQIITTTLDTRPPTQAPGAGFLYSNFGYCLLGRVIEAASGQSYAAYTSAVLAGAGVTRMAIAGNTLAERQPDEVVYQGRDGADPYRWNIARMDSHGGWIGAAPDLVRFALRVDGRTPPADTLSAASQAAMDQPSTDGRAARGWLVNGANRWHNGALDGTSAILVRTGDLCWAGLLNTRDASLVGDLDAMMWNAVGAVSRWPDSALAG
ncbi:MAG: serine hydrolase [Acidimicrobiales bacterium]